MLATVLSQSGGNLAHVQYPMPHKGMAATTCIKHRRTIEDLMIKNKISLEGHVALLFQRSSNATAQDQRSLSQPCVAAWCSAFHSEWAESKAVVEGRLGPYPLIRVAEFLGFDDVSRPSPQARIEQSLRFRIPRAPAHPLLFKNIVEGKLDKERRGVARLHR